MADTVAEQIARLNARIRTLEEVYDKAVMPGGILTSVRYGDQGTTYQPASLDDLRLRISELKAERDRLCGRGGAIFVAF